MEQIQEMEKETKQPHIDMPPLPQEETEEVTASEEPSVQNETTEKKGIQENIRELRKAKESAERERDEMRKLVEELKSAQQKKEENIAQINKEEDSELRPDDIPEWRHVDKYIKKLEAKIDNYDRQAQMNSTETRLKNQYPDFDSVVSGANIEALREKYPEIASTLNATTDLYSKAVSAYTMIKRLGIVQEDNYGPDREKALKNANKPRPLASVSPQQGDSPLSRANAFAEGLTDELREQLRKEMQEAVKYR